MNWGEYVVFIINEDGSTGDFFTGTKEQCTLVKYGIELAGRKANLVNRETNLVRPKQSVSKKS